MWLPALAPLSEPSALDLRVLFLISVATVIAVAGFGTSVVIVLLVRSFRRRLAEQKLAAIGTTTARILHQVKNPVQSLLLQAELLEEFERDGREEARREAIENVLHEAHRLAGLLSELSAWLAGSRRPLHLVPAPLHELVARLAAEVRPALEQQGITFELGPVEEAFVSIDSYYFRQAMENLVHNADEAVRGRPDARLKLELLRERGRAVVKVTDNGPGIPTDQVERIFDPFVSTKSTGMGLGLAITREIVAGHGGELRVSSTLGRGSSFSILLPFGVRAGAVPRGRVRAGVS